LPSKAPAKRPAMARSRRAVEAGALGLDTENSMGGSAESASPLCITFPPKSSLSSSLSLKRQSSRRSSRTGSPLWLRRCPLQGLQVRRVQVPQDRGPQGEPQDLFPGRSSVFSLQSLVFSLESSVLKLLPAVWGCPKTEHLIGKPLECDSLFSSKRLLTWFFSEQGG
jgi:hypothetical protein